MKLWKDRSGYYFTGPHVPDLIPVDDEVVPEQPLNGSRVCFVNAGGTVVSTPSKDSCTGVLPCENLLNAVPQFARLLIERGFSYCPGVKKLSEDFNLKDYYELEELMKSKLRSHGSFIVTHGTDYVAPFAVWMDLLAKSYDLKILILVSQRSLDKPTSDLLPLTRKAIDLVKKVPVRNALVLSRNSNATFEIHSPYEIRKYDTYKKNCFYSQTKLSFLESETPNLKKMGSRINDLKRAKLCQDLKAPPVELETFFNSSKLRNSLKIGSGLGNFRGAAAGLGAYSKCPSGPVNFLIYDKSVREKDFNKWNLSRLITSWESLEAFLTFTSGFDFQ